MRLTFTASMDRRFKSITTSTELPEHTLGQRYLASRTFTCLLGRTQLRGIHRCSTQKNCRCDCRPSPTARLTNQSASLQVNYCLALIAPVLSGKAKSFEVTQDATNAYNEKIQARLSRSVFVHCNSWYRKGGDGIISSIFPGSQSRQWWWLRAPVWKHYRATITAKSRNREVMRGDVWRHGQRRGTPASVVFGALALGLALAGVYLTGRM